MDGIAATLWASQTARITGSHNRFGTAAP